MTGRRARRAWVAGVAIAPVLLATSALAASGAVGAVTEPGPATVLLMPGSEAAREFSFANQSDGSASLQVQVLDVAEDDNGCVRPEQQDGDVTCGDGGGELGDWLDLRLVRLDGTGSGSEQELWSGTLEELQDGADLLDEVASGAAPRLRLVIALPRATTNETMSDRVSFTLRWTYTGSTESTATSVLGVEQAGGPWSDNGSGLGALAGAGTSVSLVLLAIIAALLTAGGLLVALGRRRDRRPL